MNGQYFQLAQILWEKWAIPADMAKTATKTFLRNFRKCPENVQMGLERWRKVLWAQALGNQYQHIAGEVYHLWLQLRYEHLALGPDVQKLLETLHTRYFLALITNGTSKAQWEKIYRLDLEKFFDLTLVSGDLPWEKPNFRIFHLACDYLGLQPRQCVMVGDKLETDILGASQANLGGTVWIPLSSTDVEDDDPRPDFVVRSVTELPELLPKNPKIPFRVATMQQRLPDLDDGNSNSSDGS